MIIKCQCGHKYKKVEALVSHLAKKHGQWQLLQTNFLERVAQ